MTELKKRKGGGAKTSRSETVTVRLEPKLRCFAELAARKQRRTLSSFIEWVIQEELERIYLKEPSGRDTEGITVAAAMRRLWDVEEETRFIKLGIYFPDLMTHEEQIVWKLIRENGALWHGTYYGSKNEWIWTVDEDSLDFELLRQHWPTFFSVARGEKDRSALPKWERFNPIAVQSDNRSFEEMDDEIPF